MDRWKQWKDEIKQIIDLDNPTLSNISVRLVYLIASRKYYNGSLFNGEREIGEYIDWVS